MLSCVFVSFLNRINVPAWALNRYVLWGFFIGVHLIVMKGPLENGRAFGDVNTVYRIWSEQAVTQAHVVGLHEEWVYPILAMVPMVLAHVINIGDYTISWLVLIVSLNALTFALLLHKKKHRNLVAALWWVAFLFLIGPIAFGRLDGISAALAIIGVVICAQHKAFATVLFTVAAWIKIWPGAFVVALLIAVRQKAIIVFAAAIVSFTVLAISLLLGGANYVMTFITMQTGRMIQIESPIATPWMWMARAGIGQSAPYYDTVLYTYQVTGVGTDFAAFAIDIIFVLATLLVVTLGLLAHKKGYAYESLLPELSLGIIAAFIAFNKVGSPQFAMWLTAPVILGIMLQGRRFQYPAVFVACIGALTQLVFPTFFGNIVYLEFFPLVVLTIRNALYMTVFVWSVVRLWQGFKSVSQRSLVQD